MSTLTAAGTGSSIFMPRAMSTAALPTGWPRRNRHGPSDSTEALDPWLVAASDSRHHCMLQHRSKASAGTSGARARHRWHTQPCWSGEVMGGAGTMKVIWQLEQITGGIRLLREPPDTDELLPREGWSDITAHLGISSEEASRQCDQVGLKSEPGRPSKDGNTYDAIASRGQPG